MVYIKKRYIFNKEEFIKKYNELKSSRKMAEFFKCDKTTILNYAKSIGYTNNYLLSLSEKDKQDIINKYYDNTAKELGEKYNISQSSVAKIWYAAGKKGKIGYTYHFNVNYFEKIDSFDKAYFLGLLAADGNVLIFKNNGKKQATIRLSLQEQDKDILEIFKKYISCDKPLYLSKKIINGTIHFYYTLELVSDKMAMDLKKYNIVPRKTYDFIMPDLPKEFISHFIRGYFDGDGSIIIKKGLSHLAHAYIISISGFKHNLEIIKSNLKKDNINVSFILDKRKYNSDIPFGCLKATNNIEKYKFIKYIYKDCNNLFFPRKKHKCDNFINIIETNSKIYK